MATLNKTIKTRNSKNTHCRLCRIPIIDHNSIVLGLCLSCSKLEADRKEKERMDNTNSIFLNQSENSGNLNPAYSPMPFIQEDIDGWLTMKQLTPFFRNEQTLNINKS